MKTKPPVFVTGLPRSGTSSTTAFLFWAGLYGGHIFKLRHPKHCTFENKFLKEVFDRVLMYKCLGLFEQGHSLEPAIALRAQVLHQLSSQHYSPKKSSWLFKSHTLIFFAEVVNHAFPDALWVFVERDKEQVIRSNRQTGYTNLYSSNEEWELWYQKYHAVLQQAKSIIPADRQVDFHPTRIFEGDIDHLQGLVDFVGGRWTTKLEKELGNLIGETNGSTSYKR